MIKCPNYKTDYCEKEFDSEAEDYDCYLGNALSHPPKEYADCLVIERMWVFCTSCGLEAERAFNELAFKQQLETINLTGL